MASKFAGILSPTAEPAPKLTDQPAQNDNSKNNMTTASESRDRAATAPPQDHHPMKEREDGLRAQSLEYKTHLEQAKDTSQPPSNKDSSTGVNPDTVPIDPRDAAATIAALRQNLYIAEQHILHFHNEASSRIFQLETLVRSSWDRSNGLEGNINYLTGELHKANDYNRNLNQHIIELRKEAETRETKHRAALQAANAKASASSSRTPSAPPQPPMPLPAAMQNTNTLNTLLQHNRTSIVKLRAEVRALKASKKQLQERLLTLGAVPPLDGESFLQNAGLPREVLVEWSQVLLQRDREIAGLRVMVERERNER